MSQINKEQIKEFQSLVEYLEFLLDRKLSDTEKAKDLDKLKTLSAFLQDRERDKHKKGYSYVSQCPQCKTHNIDKTELPKHLDDSVKAWCVHCRRYTAQTVKGKPSPNTSKSLKIHWFKNKTKKPSEAVDVSFDDYNDLCSECSKHDTCHKQGIDYDKMALCKIDGKIYLSESRATRQKSPSETV